MTLNLSRNEQRVLDTIWRKGPIARAEIAELIGLTTGPVTRITQRLMAEGLLVESVRHSGTRGNPMRPLEIAGEGAFTFGVSFSHRHLEVGLLDLRGRLLGVTRRTFEDARPQVLAAAAREGVEELERDLAIDRGRVVGVGFAVPGAFAADRRHINAHPYFPHLRGVDLVAALSEGMPYPVFIENDCNAAALGERVLGHGRTFPSFISVFVCHGIGGGVIIGGELHRGEHGNAGGLHAFFPLGQPRPSGHDLFDVMAREGMPIRDFPDFETPEALDYAGVRPWIARAGAQLRDALTVTSRLFDPAAIVIGGRLPPSFLEELALVIDDPLFCADSPLAKPLVRASELGPRAGVIGAAAVVLYATFLDGGAVAGADG
jgi:predicted NBD/HSP70 family sugar kinase